MKVLKQIADLTAKCERLTAERERLKALHADAVALAGQKAAQRDKAVTALNETRVRLAMRMLELEEAIDPRLADLKPVTIAEVVRGPDQEFKGKPLRHLTKEEVALIVDAEIREEGQDDE